MSLIDRLVESRMKSRMRDLEMEMESKSLEDKLKKEALTKSIIAKDTERVKVVTTLLESLTAEYQKSEAAYEAAKDHDERERKALLAELEREIAEVSELTTTTSNELTRQRQVNSTLKKQLEIYVEHSASGQEKYTELMAKRDVQMKNAEEKQERDQKRIVEVREMVEREREGIPALQEQQKHAEALVKEYVGKFEEIKNTLTSAKDEYDAARVEKEKQQKVIDRLESDISGIMARVRITQKERNREFENVVTWERKVETVQKQISVLQKLLESLTNGNKEGNSQDDQEEQQGQQEGESGDGLQEDNEATQEQDQHPDNNDDSRNEDEGEKEEEEEERK